MKLKLSLFFVIAILVINSAYSQTVPGPFDGNSFSNLNEKRSQLNTLIPELEYQMDNFQYSKDSLAIQYDIRNNESAIKNYETQLASLKPSDTARNSLQDILDNYKQRRNFLNNELERSKENAINKRLIQKSIDSAYALRRDVEYRINQLMIPKLSQQNFMFWASIAFVVLMIFLLATFFFVVYRDENVRGIIFGSDSGIQFVTLFSIVIAIILFGLTGVLEGKELAALLGSVAGYILGKSNFTNTRNNGNTTPPPAPPNPNPYPDPNPVPNPDPNPNPNPDPNPVPNPNPAPVVNPDNPVQP